MDACCKAHNVLAIGEAILRHLPRGKCRLWWQDAPDEASSS